MMEFPYLEVRPGVFRPIMAVRIYGPTWSVLVDGLLDSGSDRTLIPPKVALDLGLDLPPSIAEVAIKTPTGQVIKCKAVDLPLELNRNSTRLCWKGEIAVTDVPLRICHWGIKGFMEFFETLFDGPGHRAIFTEGDHFPAAFPPVYQ